MEADERYLIFRCDPDCLDTASCSRLECVPACRDTRVPSVQGCVRLSVLSSSPLRPQGTLPLATLCWSCNSTPSGLLWLLPGHTSGAAVITPGSFLFHAPRTSGSHKVQTPQFLFCSCVEPSSPLGGQHTAAALAERAHLPSGLPCRLCSACSTGKLLPGQRLQILVSFQV